MIKYTPEQYAESARKYRITPGPWHFNGSRYVRSGIHPNTTTVCQFGDVGSTIESDDENEANGNATASVPNLLIERDALKAAIEKAIASCPTCGGHGIVPDVETGHHPMCDGSCEHCPVPIQVAHECATCSPLRAALTGGAA